MCFVQETQHPGCQCHVISGKDPRYLSYSGLVTQKVQLTGVGVFIAEKWIDLEFDLQGISDRIMLIKLVLEKQVVTILSV